jgi:hypothetical protein
MRVISWGLRAGLHRDNGASRTELRAADPSLNRSRPLPPTHRWLTRSNDGSATERLREPQAERRRSATSVRAGGA